MRVARILTACKMRVKEDDMAENARRCVWIQERPTTSGERCWEVSSGMSHNDEEIAESPGDLIHSVLKRFGVTISPCDCEDFIDSQARSESAPD